MDLITIGLLVLILALKVFFERCRRADFALILQDLRAARDELKTDIAPSRDEANYETNSKPTSARQPYGKN